MYLLQKLARLYWVGTMIKEYNQQTETHAYKTSKDLVYKKEETKFDNITKQWLILMILPKKT